jgi:hypothetical protein
VERVVPGRLRRRQRRVNLNALLSNAAVPPILAPSAIAFSIVFEGADPARFTLLHADEGFAMNSKGSLAIHLWESR